MKREVTACDICGAEYDAAKEFDEPFHRVGLADPPPMDPKEEARLDAELKSISAEIKKAGTTEQAKAYYTERSESLKREAEKRRSISAEDRLDVDLVCHACFLKLRDHVKQIRRA